MFRNPKTKQTHVMNAKNDKFARAKRRLTPDEFSDIYRTNALSKTWKNNKKRKQWM